MKHIRLFEGFNESEDKNLYSELSNDECEEFCERVEAESISRWEFDKLNKIIKKSGPVGSLFKYNILYDSYSHGGSLSKDGVVSEGITIFNIEIQGRPLNNYRIYYDNFFINKYEDGWYIVQRRSKSSTASGKRIENYKCDQLDGLVKLLSDLGMVHKKYISK